MDEEQDDDRQPDLVISRVMFLQEKLFLHQCFEISTFKSSPSCFYIFAKICPWQMLTMWDPCFGRKLTGNFAGSYFQFGRNCGREGGHDEICYGREEMFLFNREAISNYSSE